MRERRKVGVPTAVDLTYDHLVVLVCDWKFPHPASPRRFCCIDSTHHNQHLKGTETDHIYYLSGIPE